MRLALSIILFDQNSIQILWFCLSSLVDCCKSFSSSSTFKWVGLASSNIIGWWTMEERLVLLQKGHTPWSDALWNRICLLHYFWNNDLSYLRHSLNDSCPSCPLSLSLNQKWGPCWWLQLCGTALCLFEKCGELLSYQGSRDSQLRFPCLKILNSQTLSIWIHKRSCHSQEQRFLSSAWTKVFIFLAQNEYYTKVIVQDCHKKG